MRYLEIGIETQRAGIELILSALMKLGITDAVVEDPADIDDLLQKRRATNGTTSTTACWN